MTEVTERPVCNGYAPPIAHAPAETEQQMATREPAEEFEHVAAALESLRAYIDATIEVHARDAAAFRNLADQLQAAYARGVRDASDFYEADGASDDLVAAIVNGNRA